MYNVNAMVRLTDDFRQMLNHRFNNGLYHSERFYRELLEAEFFIYLGEIEQMPEHGIFVSAAGQVFSGLCVHDFERIPDEEC